MLYLERTITVTKGVSSIDETVILYKGDKNVEIQFFIKNNPFRSKKNDAEPTYGQLVIKRENADSIFSDVSLVQRSNTVLFVITAEMIDELKELGKYTFQIRLFNDDKSSRATLPEVIGGIVIKKPICDDDAPGTVNLSYVNGSYATRSLEPEDTFNSDGTYNETAWRSGDLISDVKLNKIEDAIDTINDRTLNSVSKDYVDNEMNNIVNDMKSNITELESKDSALEMLIEAEEDRAMLVEEGLNSNIERIESQLENINNAGYITEIPGEYITEEELDNYNFATVNYVEEQRLDIADEINDKTLGLVDAVNTTLEQYATKEYVTQYATKEYVNDKIGDIDAILDSINGEVI